jgi:hypothetical protein
MYQSSTTRAATAKRVAVIKIQRPIEAVRCRRGRLPVSVSDAGRGIDGSVLIRTPRGTGARTSD